MDHLHLQIVLQLSARDADEIHPALVYREDMYETAKVAEGQTGCGAVSAERCVAELKCSEIKLF